MKEANKAILALTLATVFWATTYASAKVALDFVNPLTLALLRGTLATACLFVFAAFKGSLNEIFLFLRRHFFASLVLGALGMFLLQTLQNFGLIYSSSIMGGVLINTSPLFILVLAVLFLREKTSLRRTLGIVVGFIGIIIMLAGKNITTLAANTTLFGNLLLLAVAISWAIYSIIAKHFLKSFTPLTLTFVSYLIGTIMLIPATLIMEDITFAISLNYSAWLIVLYLGLFGSATAYLLWNYGVKRFDVSRAGVFQYLSPVIAIFIGFTFLQEAITIYNAVGIVLVFLGIFFAEKRTRSQIT